MLGIDQSAIKDAILNGAMQLNHKNKASGFEKPNPHSSGGRW
jgi:hypothetical protein